MKRCRAAVGEHAAANGELRWITDERDNHSSDRVHRDTATATAARTVVAGADRQVVAVTWSPVAGVDLQLLLDPPPWTSSSCGTRRPHAERESGAVR